MKRPGTRPEELLSFLDEQGIETRTVEHPPVYTVEQAREHREGMQGGFSKNLFLRNKKGKMWLVVAEESCPIDLKALGRAVGAGPFSFASRQRLETYLGVEAGAVSPFGLINDSNHDVRVIIDQGLLALDPLHFHPLDNSMTTIIGAQDLLRFMKATGHLYEVVDLKTV